MRICKVEVRKWRNLEDVEIQIPADSRIVCLVGENGSGKSTVLELLSAASHHLGISSGLEIPRGDPFGELHDFSVYAEVPQDLLSEIREAGHEGEAGDLWGGVLRLTSVREEAMGSPLIRVVAEGVTEPGESERLASFAVERLRSRLRTQHLYLDADRAYPPLQLQPYQLGEIWTHDWSSADWTRHWAFKPTKTLYEEWIKYFIATEERIAAEHIASVRRAREEGSPAPDFVDPFESYKRSVQTVLPHLRFVGVETSGAQRTILFDSAGSEIPFSRLSGGEREIAFLVGQIERFGLRQGLLLIDEPELHLNPDLLRTWVAFLRDTIVDGQVWVATHSLEAVEVAGPDSSFIFEKDATDRATRKVSALVGRPVVSALSAAIGAPAFSLAKLRFVFVEGDRQSRERERFFDLCGDPSVNRFMEGGSCHEVLRRLEYVSELASAAGEQLRIGGVIDRDFRSSDEAKSLELQHGVHVLGCHEVENMFLHPEVLQVLLQRSGSSNTAEVVLRSANERFAGLWIAQRADSLLPHLSATPKESLKLLSGLSRGQISPNVESLATESAAKFNDATQAEQWRSAVLRAYDEFEAMNDSESLWLNCLGKQCLSQVAASLGFSSTEVLQRSIIRAWNDGLEMPRPLLALRRYLEQLSTS